jgi:hypothetical protein
VKIKELALEVKNHIRTDFHPLAYSLIFLLATVLISINYSINFEHKIIHSFYGTSLGFLVYITYYMIPYFLGIALVLSVKKEKAKLKNPQLWIKSFLFISIIGSFSAWSPHVEIAEYFGRNPFEVDYLKSLLSNLKKVIPYVISLYLIYLLYDRNSKNFYGFAENKLRYRPFFAMLLLVLPLVVAASFLPDFQSYYPRFKYWANFNLFGLNKFEMNMIFLFCYSMDFISVELMFRGALVIGMVKLLGREAVLPMALVYMVFHFGKPIGETISSFFGGYILGVLSYNHRNIKGGIVVHIGLAWMMELAAILQHIRTS